MDAMKVLEILVWDKHTGDIIGFVALILIMLHYKSLDKVASHILDFLFS